MLFFAFFSSIYTFYINKKWYFRNLLSKIPFCQQSETIKDILIVLKMILRFGVKNNMIDFHQFDIKFLLIMKRKTLEVYLEIIKEN